LGRRSRSARTRIPPGAGALPQAAGRRRPWRRHRRRHDHAVPLRSRNRGHRCHPIDAVPEARAHSRSGIDAARANAHGPLPRILAAGHGPSAFGGRGQGGGHRQYGGGARCRRSDRAQGGAGNRRAAADHGCGDARLDARPSRRGDEADRSGIVAFPRPVAIRRGALRICGVPRPQEVRPTMSLEGKTLFITGASRGIGLAIGLRAARDGANVAIAAKTAEPHPKLAGTIYTAAEDIERAGGKALPLVVDVRDEMMGKEALDKAAASFGGIDIVVNNASAIQLTDTSHTDMKRFDLMHQINTRGTFVVSKWAIPYLEKAANPHILMLSPPLDMQEKWFARHTAYTMAKFGMSLVVLGLAGELRAKGIAVNALWPRTVIATAAVRNLLGGDTMMRQSRKPEILADAAYAVFSKPSRELTGRFLIDDTFLAETGVTDFDQYRVDPTQKLAPDFFVPESIAPPRGVSFEAVSAAAR